MGHRIDYAGLPLVCDILGVKDVELYLRGLVAVREALKAEHATARN